MKKFGTLLLASALLFAVFCLSAAAVEGEPTFTFDVKGINVGITGEDGSIFTTQEAYDNGNPTWAVTLLIKEQEDGTFVITEGPLPGGGSIPSVSIGDGVVALVIHSAGDDPNEFSNAEAKLAALAATPGMIIILEGIDLEDEGSSGTAALYPADGANTPADDTSSEEDVSSEEEGSSEVVESDEPEESSAASTAEESKTESSAAATSSQAASSVASTASQSSDTPAGLSGGMIALIVGLAVIVVVAVVVIIVVMRKK